MNADLPQNPEILPPRKHLFGSDMPGSPEQRVSDYMAGYSCGYSDATNRTPLRDEQAARLFFDTQRSQRDYMMGLPSGPSHYLTGSKSDCIEATNLIWRAQPTPGCAGQTWREYAEALERERVARATQGRD